MLAMIMFAMSMYDGDDEQEHLGADDEAPAGLQDADEEAGAGCQYQPLSPISPHQPYQPLWPYQPHKHISMSA